MADIDDVMDKCNDILERIEELELHNYSICTMCRGSGEVVPSYPLENPPPSTIECPRCAGAGKLLAGSSVEKD